MKKKALCFLVLYLAILIGPQLVYSDDETPKGSLSIGSILIDNPEVKKGETVTGTVIVNYFSPEGRYVESKEDYINYYLCTSLIVYDQDNNDISIGGDCSPVTHTATNGELRTKFSLGTENLEPGSYTYKVEMEGVQKDFLSWWASDWTWYKFSGSNSFSFTVVEVEGEKEIWKPGDNKCEWTKGENCKNSKADCWSLCYEWEECDPSNPRADDAGCVVIEGTEVDSYDIKGKGQKRDDKGGKTEEKDKVQDSEDYNKLKELTSQGKGDSAEAKKYYEELTKSKLDSADISKQGKKEVIEKINREETLNVGEFITFIKAIEEKNPDKKWNQIITQLHTQYYPEDVDLEFFWINLFKNGPDNEGYGDVNTIIGTLPPRVIVLGDGTRFNVAHTYAGIRAGLNRNALSSWFMTNVNTGWGDSVQVIGAYLKGKKNPERYKSHDQVLGNKASKKLQKMLKKNPDMKLSDAYAKYFEEYQK